MTDIAKRPATTDPLPVEPRLRAFPRAHVQARTGLAAAWLAGLGITAITPVRAADGNWTGAASANWSAAGNWSTNPTVPGTAAGDIIGLNNNIAGNVTVTIDSTSRTVGTLNIGDSDSTHTFTLAASGGASLLLNNGGSGAQINKLVSTASDSITSPISVLDAGGLAVTVNTGTLGITGGLNNNGNLLTFGGTGNTSFTGVSNFITGAGGITKNGGGQLILGAGGATPAHNYTGPTTINGGSILIFNNLPANTNLAINNGALEEYWTSTFNRGLGSGAGQWQITGGTSGFSGQGAQAATFGNSGTTLTWGSAFFDPDVFMLQSPTANLDGKMNFNWKINLNGADRTILNAKDHLGANGYVQMNSEISNSTGVAGLAKTGPGTMILAASNTFNGPLTIGAGLLQANSSAALGNASATNTLIFDGGSLRAGGAITSPAARGLTLNNTATIDSNNFAVSFAGDMTGTAGLVKNGVGTLTLAGANNYAGPTVVNAGGVQFSKEASLYSGNTANWTAANLNFKAGSTLGLNVDSAGTAGFTAANLTTLLGNVSVANSAAAGLQSGVTLALDTSTATAGTFTPGSAIADSTGAFGGRVSLTKQGAGTLVLNQANTYSGTTTISGGTLQLDAGGALSTAPLHLNGGALAINRSGTLIQGTHLASIIGGTGSLANVGSGTLTLNAPTYHTGNTSATAGNITLSHARAIQNSPLNTTGTGSVTLSGVTEPVFGGLSNSGTTRDLASVIDASYGAVSGITLNAQSGLTHTYGGVIANGAASMTLTKTGPGTQVLQGANTYGGTTFLQAGNLELSGAGSILNSALSFRGGTLILTNTAAGTDRVANGSAITANGGTLTLANTSGASVYAENIGTVNLASGQMNFFQLTNQGGAGSQTLTLAGLTRTGASNSSAVTFSSSTTGPNTTKNMIVVSGASATPAGQIIGAWATTGVSSTSQTDFAVYNASGQVVPAAIAATTQASWTSAANAYTVNTAETLGATRTIAALRNTLAAGSVTLATGANLQTYGILNGAGALTIAPGTGGVLTTPTGGGNLLLTAGVGPITVNAPVNNNSGAVTLVKSGVGTLTLGSTTSTYSGGTIINSGTVSITDNTNLGAAGSGITFDGSATLSVMHPSGNGTPLIDLGSRPIAVNNGAIATLTGGTRPNYSIGGAVSGNGGVVLTHGTFWGKISLASTANTFTGPLTVTSTGDDGNSIFIVNSLADGAGYGNITLNNSSTDGDLIGLDYGSGGANGAGGGGATAPLVLNNRQLVVATSGNNVLNNSSAQAININTDIAFSGTGARAMRFGVQARAGSGVSTFAGKLTDNAGGAFTPTFGGGHWVLSGANTYTGKTSINAGTLSINSIQNIGSNTANALGIPVGTATVIDMGSGASLRYNGTLGAGHSSDRVVNLLNGGATYTLEASGTGTFNLSGGVVSPATTGTSILRLDGTGRGQLGAVANGTGGGLTALQKFSAGTWTLSGANTYTGSTSVFDGTLALGAGGSIHNGSTLTVNGAGAVFDLGANQSDTVFTVSLQNGGQITGSGSSTLTTTDAFNLQSGSVSAILGGSGRALNKSSAGTVTLSGLNTYSGSTIITGAGGTLALSHPSSNNNISASPTISVDTSTFLNVTGLNGGSLTLASGQTLKGRGTLTGGLVIGGGGIVSPGASPGTLNNVGAVTYGPGGTYLWEVNNATGTKGGDPGYDWHNITGALGITSTSGNPFIIDIAGLSGGSLGTVANWNPLTSRTWTIATASGGISGFSPSVFSLATANFFSNNAANSLGAAAFSLTQVGNDLILNYSGAGTASSYWDTNGSTSGAGATPSGTWSNGGGLFSYSVSGTQATGNWVANNVAVFAAGTGAGSYAVTISGGVSASGIVVEDGAMTLNSSTLTLAGAAPHITVDSAQPLTVNSQIANTTGWSKLGSGVATLTAANTYTGNTTLTTGRVQLGGTPVGSVGSITSSEIGRGALVFNGGALSSADTSARTVLNPVQFTGNGTVGDATNNGTITFADGASLGSSDRTLTVAANSVARFDGVVSGTSGVGLTVRGDGVYLPTNSNTYDGPTNIGGGIGLGGTLRVQTGNELALGANPAVFNQNQLRLNGGTLQVSNSDLTINDSNRGLSVGPGGGTFLVDNGRVLNLSSPNTFDAVSGASTFFKAGAGTFNFTGNANYNAVRVEQGVYRQNNGVTTVAESGGTGLRIASGAVYDLAGGELRVDRIQEISGGTFTWGSGRLTVYTGNDTDGGTDFSSNFSGSSPQVRVGHTLTVTADSIETSNGSILQAHGSPTFYANLGARFNNYAFSGILDLTAEGDVLEVEINPALLRPTGAYNEYGSIPLVFADSILGEFDLFTGVSPDALPFVEYLGAYNSLLAPNQMPADSWYLEYAHNVVNPTGAPNPGTNGSGTFDVIYFHYNFGLTSVNVPEPSVLPLICAGIFGLRLAFRRRSDDQLESKPAARQPRRRRRHARANLPRLDF